MRTYAPAATESVLDGILDEPSLARGVTHHAVLPAREAIWQEHPDWLDPRIRAGLASRGIERLYSHQAEAIEAVRAGRDVVVVTPTASGKTLCYALPALRPSPTIPPPGPCSCSRRRPSARTRSPSSRSCPRRPG